MNKQMPIGIKKMGADTPIRMPMGMSQTAPDPLETISQVLIQFNEKKLAQELVRTFYRQARTVEQLDHVGRLAFQVKDYATSIQACERVMELVNTNPHAIYAARSNLINALVHHNYPDIAIKHIQRQEALQPVDRDRDLKKAYCLFLMRRRDEAEQILRRVLDDPNTDAQTRMEIQFNLGTYEIWNGDFRGGLRKFLKYGPEFNTWNRRTYPLPRWSGQIADGHSLIVVAEAGIGDEFINVRFVKRIMDAGMDVIWMTERQDLHSVFTRSLGCRVASTMDEALSLSAGSVASTYCYSMDLPVLLDVGTDDLWDGRYIVPHQDYVRKHISTYRGDGVGPNIGLRWQGNPDYEQDNHRTVPFSDLVAAVRQAYPHARLYSLQYDGGDMPADSGVIPALDGSETWEDTLAIMSILDVVVTSCTSIAHAASAMGVPTIVLPPISAYYVWCQESRYSPWYSRDTIVLHQKQPRDWSAPLKEVPGNIEDLMTV